ncbi:DUF6443 domain-containing protein [Dyadobacter aurulentus]|uniref:DUF6443 domain-containing protein n=1 Tax=Dyadobacter sp. UC 10 TaxID=2605428 RepID=UPI0011F38FDD|nr:DUF6443 domain-containing protein [Dyadobacter sp. UC 10]KAA0990012.1 RHS repeat-associated core domain-containing protein [Dyadobacter sp. UC 10]
MKQIVLFFLTMLTIPSGAHGQQTNARNYIISRTYKQAGANANDVSKVTTQVRYLDGLGRPLQNVAVGQSPAGTDLIQPIAFDAAGRQPAQFLSYVAGGNGAFKSNAVADAAAWYADPSNPAGLTNYGLLDVSAPQNDFTFETSPLSRVIGDQAPGARSNTAVIKYKTNCCGELKRYDYNKAGNTIVENGGYAPGTVTYIFKTDENYKQTKEYYDLSGRLICRQQLVDPAPGPGNVTLFTYYVYDNIGLLRAVLQPGFQSENSLANQAFTYDYDARGRVIVKNIPGGGKIEIVYDQYDRPALTRDANQLSRNVWGFTKYDALNRPVATGEIPGSELRSDWAAKVDIGAQHHENRNNAVTAGYSLNLTAPASTTEAHLLTITFYDNYTFSKPAQLNYVAAYYTSNNANVKGQTTGGRVRVLPGDGSAGGWLTSVTYYDPEYRQIQVTRQLHDLGANAFERLSTQYKYDLAPVIAEQKTEQAPAGVVANAHTAIYTYDHADRLLLVKEKVTIGAKTKEAYTLAQRYTPLGALKSKWFHAYPASNGLAYRTRTDYTSNIRGWLTDGANVYRKKLEGPDLPFFAFTVDYLSGTIYTNGNITSMSWKGRDEAAFTKGLTFSYDGANRLLGSTGIGTYKETESGIQYDLNGNIKKLTRKDAAGATIDNLTYNYTGNRLSSVADAGTAAGVKTGTSNYIYDANGNTTTDETHAATLTYSYLNLPRTVTVAGKAYRYDYDASGTKHKYYAVNAADTVLIKYAGRFEYDKNNTVKRVHTTEGQVVRSGDTLRFDYFLKDHLGNVRIVFNELGSTLQKTDYYPFGLEIDRNNPVQPQNARNSVNRYNFLGRESQPETGYMDLMKRFYDPAIGRFTSVDPVIAGQENYSTYQYGWNNPILRSDPNGDCPECDDEAGQIGMMIGPVVMSVGNSIRTLAYNAGDALGITPARKGMKWEAVEKRVGDSYETTMEQVPRQGFLKDAGGHLLDGVNAMSAVSPAGGTTSSLVAKTAPNAVVTSTVAKAGKDAIQVAGEIKISNIKDALRKAYAELGIPGALPKGEKGKFGSPTAGNSKKGYRLDPGHPDRRKGHDESVPHINYWDWTAGKKDRGGKYGAIPLVDPK